MKPRSYFRLALLFPFILWGICALIYFMLSRYELSEAWNYAIMPLAFYVIGIILWFLPYTILAIGLWLWSRNKSTKSLWRSALLAPLFLLVLMLIEVTAVSLPAGGMEEMLGEIASSTALLGFFSLTFGYLCVGIAAGFYRLLKSRSIVVEETPAE